MKHVLLFLFAFAFISIVAQPVINSNVFPAVGARTVYYKSNTANTFNAGAAGPGAVWNFASLDTVLGSSVQKTVQADTCFTYPDFPSVVNRAIQVGNIYAYSYLDNTKAEYYGTESLFLTIILTDPEKLLTFPFTYTNQFTDYFHDADSTTFGYTTVKADGYGSLSLPTGTYPNALRVKTTEKYRTYTAWDEFDGTPTDSVMYDGLYYRWYDANTPTLLLEYSKLVKYMTYQGTRYDIDSLKHVVTTRSLTTDVAEVETGFESSVYPNPAGSFVMINAEATIERVDVADLCGKVIMSQNFFDKSIMLNLESLATGTYCVQLTTSDNRKKGGEGAAFLRKHKTIDFRQSETVPTNYVGLFCIWGCRGGLWWR